ncbi:hypothetical protein CVU37_13435 [candidate division BRC1 bacterium HGW-BRC1-1]|nr:MAG: hypothetical protein CVU37_13435 [candidate division BRC1 bacterium HGW-BRC1-1]
MGFTIVLIGRAAASRVASLFILDLDGLCLMRYFSLSLLLTGMLFLSVGTFAAEDTTASLAAQAVRLTAQKKLPEAERLYRQLAKDDPADGLPRLARFLTVTGQTTAAREMLTGEDAAQLPALLRARAALAAGDVALAENLTTSATLSEGGDVYSAVVVRVNALIAGGQQKAASEILADATLDTQLSPQQRREFFDRLTHVGDSGQVARVALPLVESLAENPSIGFEPLRDTALLALQNLTAGEAASRFRDELSSASATSAPATWMLAIAQVRRGEVPEARELLKKRFAEEKTTASRVLIGRELASLLDDDRPATMRLLEELVPLTNGDPVLRLQAAQMAYKMQDFPRAQRHLKDLDTSTFDEGRMWAWRNVSVGNIGKVSAPAQVISEFEAASEGLPYDKIRELAEAPWVRLSETNDQLKVHKLLLDRLAETSAPAWLHILRMSLENQLINSPGVFEALTDYVAAAPGDFPALEELGALHGARVFQYANNLSKSDVATTPAEFYQMAGDAAAVLWKAAEARPYQPEAFDRLMALYVLVGDQEQARRVPQFLLVKNENSPEALGQAGFLYATNGFAEEAVPIYERAMKLRPDDMNLRLNYAGALTRVGRNQDAEGIYWSLMEHGMHDRQYHTHEIYANAYRLAERTGRIDHFLGFLAGLLKKPDVAQRDEFLLDVGKLLTFYGRPDAAVPFLEAASSEFPDRAEEARASLIRTHVARRDFDAAEKLIVEAEAATTSVDAQISARFGRADLARERGDIEAAVKIWEELAQAHPKDTLAARGLLAGAELLAAQNPPDKARASVLLERFNELNVGDDEDNHQAAALRDKLGQ